MNASAKPTQLEVYRAELLPTAKADELYQALPSHIKPAVFERNLLNAMMANPDLMKFSAALVYREVAKAAGLGLLLDPLLGEGYLVPAYNYKTKAVEPQLRVGYKGMCKLARHTGEVGNIYAHEVHERDHVEADLGFPKVFHHRPKLFSDRGEIIGYVAIITFRDGTFDFEPMSVEQCHEIRDRSDAWKAFIENKIKSTPWKTDDSEMSKKTVLRRLLKRQPQSPELVAAIRIEDEADFPDMNRANVPPVGPRDAAPPRNVKTIEHQPADTVLDEPEKPAESVAEESKESTPAPKRAPSEPPKAVVPHDLVPQQGDSYEIWAKRYIAALETSPDTSAVFKWVDLNQPRLKKLEGSPEWTGKVKKATQAIVDRLRKAADPITSGPQAHAEPQDMFPGDKPSALAQELDAAPRPRGRPPKAKVPDFEKDYDGWVAFQIKSIADAPSVEVLETIFSQTLDLVWDQIQQPDRIALREANSLAEDRLQP